MNAGSPSSAARNREHVAIDALVDTCVLLDVADPASSWHSWSVDTLEGFDGRGRLFVDPVIYAECAMGFDAVEDVDLMLAEPALGYRDLSRDALFLAGSAFLRYRRRGGTRSGVLPDFFIGAHAAVEGLALVTRDDRRFSSYFPTIEVISPG